MSRGRRGARGRASTWVIVAIALCVAAAGSAWLFFERRAERDRRAEGEQAWLDRMQDMEDWYAVRRVGLSISLLRINRELNTRTPGGPRLCVAQMIADEINRHAPADREASGSTTGAIPFEVIGASQLRWNDREVSVRALWQDTFGDVDWSAEWLILAVTRDPDRPVRSVATLLSRSETVWVRDGAVEITQVMDSLDRSAVSDSLERAGWTVLPEPSKSDAKPR